jgi:hypothetical protein
MKRARETAGKNPKCQSRLARPASESISRELLNRDASAVGSRLFCAQLREAMRQ